MHSTTNQRIPSINFHLWEPCNMRCKFCFALENFSSVTNCRQNDKYIHDFVISDDDFKTFLSINQNAATKVKMVPETNEQIKDSYVMIDPAGRFFSDGTGTYHYSKPILEVGIETALAEVQMSYEKFLDRDGYYDWKK